MDERSHDTVDFVSDDVATECENNTIALKSLRTVNTESAGHSSGGVTFTTSRGDTFDSQDVYLVNEEEDSDGMFSLITPFIGIKYKSSTARRLPKGRSKVKRKDIPDGVINPNRDLDEDHDKASYRDWLKSININNELHWVVRRNQPVKLKLICQLLAEEGIDLGSDDLRGSSRETALSLAVVKERQTCAEILIQYGGSQLILKAYDTKLYDGATALHLAIMKENVYLIDCILRSVDMPERYELLHKEARGEYFQNTYRCPCQPLSLAAVVGNMEIFDILVGYGADLWHGDTETGNTVLHNLAVVAVGSPNHAVDIMLRILDSSEVQKWWQVKKDNMASSKRLYYNTVKAGLLKAENNNGYTPFAYAACFGATKFAGRILSMSGLYNVPQWRIGPTRYVLYEMNEIDPAVPPEELPLPPNHATSRADLRASALESFAFVLKDEQLDFGSLPAVRNAVINKWNSYKLLFFIWMFVHLAMMICFTLCIQHRVLPRLDTTDVQKDDTVESFHSSNTSFRVADVLLLVDKHSSKDVTMLVLECFVLTVAILYFVLEVIDIVSLLYRKRCSAHGYYIKHRRRTIPIFLTLQFDAFRVIAFVFSVAVLTLLGLRLEQSPSQDMAYAVATICGWSFMLFFTRAFKNIGIFTVMLQRMITREMLYFSLIFFLFMLGFGTATYCLFQESIAGAPSEVHSVLQTLFSHFRLLVGLEELAIEDQARLPWLAKLVFMGFVLLCNIMLLNMLIAAMNSTYTNLDNMKELLWLKMRTKAVLMIERRLPRRWRSKCNLVNFQGRWFIRSQQILIWHPLASGIESNTE